MVWSPRKVLGVLPNTTARAPVDIVAANHGLTRLEEVYCDFNMSNPPCKMRDPVPQPDKLRRLIFRFLLPLCAIINLLLLTETHVGKVLEVLLDSSQLERNRPSCT